MSGTPRSAAQHDLAASLLESERAFVGWLDRLGAATATAAAPPPSGAAAASTTTATSRCCLPTRT